jgi:hypothetical protein
MLKILIPTDSTRSSILLRTVIADWAEANPEDTFASEDPKVHRLIPADLRHDWQESTMTWEGFWSGMVPSVAPTGDAPETPQEIILTSGITLSRDDLVTIKKALEAL